MKYGNLLDAVMGQIHEGKSYKRNKDEDVDAKKKEDKQKRDNKKEPVAEALGDGMAVAEKRKTLKGLIKKAKDKAIEFGDKPEKAKHYDDLVAKYEKELADLKKVKEDLRPSEVKPVAGSPLAAGGRVSGMQLKPGMIFRVVTGPLSKKDQFCAREKEIDGVKWVYLIDQYGDQDWHKAEEVFPTKISMRMADASTKASFTSVAEDYAPVFEDEEDHEGSLEEAYGRGWAILPATVALYGKKVVDIKTAASEWATDKYPTTILVCHKNENGRDRMLFLSSSGDCRTQYKVGQSSETYHDQTGASKGIYTILNIVVFQGGEIVYKANEQGLAGKASVAVFK